MAEVVLDTVPDWLKCYLGDEEQEDDQPPDSSTQALARYVARRHAACIATEARLVRDRAALSQRRRALEEKASAFISELQGETQP